MKLKLKHFQVMASAGDHTSIVQSSHTSLMQAVKAAKKHGFVTWILDTNTDWEFTSEGFPRHCP